MCVSPSSSPPEPKQRQCRVLFEYVPQNEDELELKVGDIVDVTEEVCCYYTNTTTLVLHYCYGEGEGEKGL